MSEADAYLNTVLWWEAFAKGYRAHMDHDASVSPQEFLSYFDNVLYLLYTYEGE